MLFSIIKKFLIFFLTLIILGLSGYIFLYYFFYDFLHSVPYMIDVSLNTFLYNQPTVNTLPECDWTREYLFSEELAHKRAEVEAANREKMIMYAQLASCYVCVGAAIFGYYLPPSVSAFALSIVTMGILGTTDLFLKNPGMVSGVQVTVTAAHLIIVQPYLSTMELQRTFFFFTLFIIFWYNDNFIKTSIIMTSLGIWYTTSYSSVIFFILFLNISIWGYSVAIFTTTCCTCSSTCGTDCTYSSTSNNTCGIFLGCRIIVTFMVISFFI